MINLWAQFPQRESHRLGILVDQYGFTVKFIPKSAGVVGNWYPETDTAAVFIKGVEQYLSDREPAGGCIDDGAMGESHVYLESNGAFTRIKYRRPGGEWFVAQVTDEELRNLLAALRTYFGFEEKTGILQRGRDW